MDGVKVENSTRLYEFNTQSGSGDMVIGHCYTKLKLNYSSVMVDELTFWNHALTSVEIQAIYTMHQ